MSPSGPPVTTYCMRAMPRTLGLAYPQARAPRRSIPGYRYFDMTFPRCLDVRQVRTVRASPAKRSSSASAAGNSRVDERTCEHELPPTGRPAHRRRPADASRSPVGSTCVRCASRASRRLCRKSLTSMKRGELPFVDRVVEPLALEPLGVRALLAAAMERLVEARDPPGRPPGVIRSSRAATARLSREDVRVARRRRTRVLRSRAPGRGRGAGRTCCRRRT